MKLLYCIILTILLPIITQAQIVVQTSTLKATTPDVPVITINAKLIGKDSVIIPYDNNYVIVQDACTSIIRHGHYNFKDHVFFGKFRDIKANDTLSMIAEGAFSKKGLKEGPFIIHYPDGRLQAQGNFTEDKFDGPWVFYYPNGNLRLKGSFKNGKYTGYCEAYYEDGRPKLFFDAGDKACKISGAWSTDGTKTVDKGNGNYVSPDYPYWTGKISSGTPDSTWTCSFSLNGGTTVVEYFKKGQFYRGHTESGSFSRNYDDKSAISLLPPLPGLKFDHSQYLDISTSCNGTELAEALIKIFDKTIPRRTIRFNGSGVSTEGH